MKFLNAFEIKSTIKIVTVEIKTFEIINKTCNFRIFEIKTFEMEIKTFEMEIKTFEMEIKTFEFDNFKVETFEIQN